MLRREYLVECSKNAIDQTNCALRCSDAAEDSQIAPVEQEWSVRCVSPSCEGAGGKSQEKANFMDTSGYIWSEREQLSRGNGEERNESNQG